MSSFPAEKGIDGFGMTYSEQIYKTGGKTGSGKTAFEPDAIGLISIIKKQCSVVQIKEELKDTFEFWIIELKLASPKYLLHPEYCDVAPPVPECHICHVLWRQARFVLQHWIPSATHEGKHKVFL